MEGEGRAPPDVRAGYRALAVLLPLFVLALAVYVVRIWTRTRPKYRLNAADYTVSVAIFAEAISIILTIVAVSKGFGRPFDLYTADDGEIIGITTFVVFIIALWASAFARISISCMLLTLTQNGIWKVVLWTTIASQGAALAACDLAELLQCRPIRAMWAVVPDSYCIPSAQLWIMVCVFAGIGMAGDVICAVLPVLIIWRLSRSKVEKTLVSILMGLGMLSALCGVFKLLILKSWDPTSESAVSDIMSAYVWIRVEEILLIIAACAPLLKSPIEGLLHRQFGLPRFVPRLRTLNSVHTMPFSSGKARYFGWNGSPEHAPVSTELSRARSGDSSAAAS